MNFYPGMPLPNIMPLNNQSNMIPFNNMMDNGMNYMNNIFNKFNDFETKIKNLEQRINKLEQNNKHYNNYLDNDNSLYMI